MAEELHFSVDVFTVLLTLGDEGELIDAQCDCDEWERNQQRPPEERFCDHLQAAKAWVVAEGMGVELENKLEREVV